MMELKELLHTLSGVGAQRMEDVGFLAFFVVLSVSLLSSLFLSFLYLTFYQSRATGSQIHRAFPLLGLSITAIFITIQFSLPLSLGLLGALSIVRFRTPIKEPEEIGFVMLVVAASLACATFNMFLLGLFFIVAVAGLLLMRLPFLSSWRRQDGMLTLTLPAHCYETDGVRILEFLRERLPRGRVDAITEQDGETVLSYSFLNLDVTRLHQLQQSLRTLDQAIRSHVFYNRSAQV